MGLAAAGGGAGRDGGPGRAAGAPSLFFPSGCAEAPPNVASAKETLNTIAAMRTPKRTMTISKPPNEGSGRASSWFPHTRELRTNFWCIARRPFIEPPAGASVLCKIAHGAISVLIFKGTPVPTGTPLIIMPAADSRQGPRESFTDAIPEKPSARAAAAVTSMTRPRVNGPRSLMRTTIERPF